MSMVEACANSLLRASSNSRIGAVTRARLPKNARKTRGLDEGDVYFLMARIPRSKQRPEGDEVTKIRSRRKFLDAIFVYGSVPCRPRAIARRSRATARCSGFPSRRMPQPDLRRPARGPWCRRASISRGTLLTHVFRRQCNHPACFQQTSGQKMKIQYSRSILLLSALLLGAVAVAADAPKGNEGFSFSKPTVIDLSSEFPGTAGLQLRLRVLTIKPGGHIGIHNHKERPSVVYFVQGTDTVTREDGTSHTFHPGDTTAEPGTTVHWHKNDGKDDAIFVAVDVLKKETPK